MYIILLYIFKWTEVYTYKAEMKMEKIIAFP